MDWKTVEMVMSVEFWRMGLLWTLSLLYSYFLLILGVFFGFNIHPLPSYSRRDPLLQTGRPLCIITGATSGLGAAAAKSLSGKGYHVIVAGRSLQQISKTIREIKQHNNKAQLQGFQVDTSSIHSIMEFKTSIDKWLLDSNLHPSVQLLINNAGILAATCRVTADGYDQMMETNYIGPFVLTNLLLPLLKNSPMPSRIVNVTSFTHRCVPSNAQVNMETLSQRCSRNQLALGKYPFGCTYEYSKFCLLLFTYELHRKLYLMDPSPKISVIAADPGVVETNIMRELPQHLSHLAFTVLRFMYLLQSPENGVDSIIDAALAPPEASGKYFFGGKRRTIKSSSLSYNSRLAEELWACSCKLISESEFGLQISRDSPHL